MRMAKVDSYPSLTTADVYAVIGYYLANREEIDAYVRQRDEQADQLLRDMAASLTPEAHALRARKPDVGPMRVGN